MPSRVTCTEAVLSRPKYLAATFRMLSRAQAGSEAAVDFARLRQRSAIKLATHLDSTWSASA